MSLKEIFIKNKCDKATKHRYYELYQQDFDKFKNDQINILEIGTFKGESTQSWLDYFSKAKIYTADTFERVAPEKVSALKSNRVQWFKVDSTSTNCKENFKNLNIQFDFIIDAIDDDMGLISVFTEAMQNDLSALGNLKVEAKK